VVFVSGAWLVLHLVDRQTQTAPLAGRLVLLLALLGLLATADAATEGAYLVIPKKEETLSVGCCSEALEDQEQADRLQPRALLREEDRPKLWGAYYGINGLMALALAGYIGFGKRWRRGPWLVPLLAGAVLSLAINAVFLLEVAAPAILHLPYHHCAYDLLPRRPVSLVPVVMFVVGCFAVGWACLTAWLGADPEAAPFLPSVVRPLLVLALVGYVGSLLMMSEELVLAWRR
jgi:hypothetical protein